MPFPETETVKLERHTMQTDVENAWFTVISPEGCAAILWGDRSKAQEMASKLKLTANELIELGVIDENYKLPFA